MEVQGYNMPEDLLYQPDHYWVKVEGDAIVMGMDDFSQKLAGEIVYVQLPEDGKTLKKGKKLAKVESGKWLGKVISPVSGEVLAVNEALEEKPGLINEDCYGAGWMYKIKPDDMAELDDLIKGSDAGAVEAWIKEDMEKYSS